MILCERGIRTFETYTRNTLDLAAVPLLHHLTHLPVIVDPSHATGKRWLVKPMALAGVAAGADGIMVEVHPRPDEALSDGEQSITLEQFADLMAAVRPIHELVRGLHGDAVLAGAGAQGRRVEPALSATDDGDPAATSQSDDGPRSSAPAARLRGEPRLPGDKSISHRALLLAALADGESRIDGAGDGADVRTTAALVARLGVDGGAR